MTADQHRLFIKRFIQEVEAPPWLLHVDPIVLRACTLVLRTAQVGVAEPP